MNYKYFFLYFKLTLAAPKFMETFFFKLKFKKYDHGRKVKTSILSVIKFVNIFVHKIRN